MGLSLKKIGFLFGIFLLYIVYLPALVVASEAGIRVHFLSVGHADAALIECDGHYAMIDCGSDKIKEDGFNSYRVDTYLQQEGVEKLDYVFISHYDTDHYGGLSDVLEKRKVGTVYGPKGSGSIDTNKMNALRMLLKKRWKKIKTPQKGKRFSLGSTEIEVIAVDEGTSKNDCSLVLMVTYKDVKYLFPGDIEQKVERILVDKEANLKCNVLKVSHHGSSTSSSTAFMNKAKPEYAILCTSESDNCDAFDNLEQSGAIILRTDAEGIIICESDGNTVTVKNTNGKQLN